MDLTAISKSLRALSLDEARDVGYFEYGLTQEQVETLYFYHGEDKTQAPPAEHPDQTQESVDQIQEQADDDQIPQETEASDSVVDDEPDEPLDSNDEDDSEPEDDVDGGEEDESSDGDDEDSDDESEEESFDDE